MNATDFIQNPVKVQAPIINLFLFIIVLHAPSTSNPIETIWSVLLLYLILRWNWHQSQPGIMLYCLLIPFIEIHTTLLEANSYDLKLNDLFIDTGRKTFFLSSISLLAVAIGVKLISSRSKNLPRIHRSLQTATSKLNYNRLLTAFFASSLVNTGIQFLIAYNSPIRQLETYANEISNVFLFALTLKFMVDKKKFGILALIYAYLITQSFYSFFSDWKDPLILLLVASLTTIRKFNLNKLIKLTPIIAPTFLLLLVWQSIKGEYRAFLNGGQFSQEIIVSQEDAFGKFQSLSIEAISQNKLLESDQVEATYRRVGYLEYFANAVAKVPSTIPHENGKLLVSNLQFALIPRILDPAKGTKNDKAKVEKYTDFYFGSYGGSSFSLGHYCEAYIDWGQYGMLIQLLIYGILGGFTQKFIMSRTAKMNALMAMGILWVCIKPWGSFQQDMITTTGQFFWGGVCHLFLFFPLYSWASEWLQSGSNTAEK